MKNLLSREEFEKQYCEGSEITKQEYEENFVTLPCNCKEKECNGWACVTNKPLSIKAHMDLYI